jgi:hypothetical protein
MSTLAALLREIRLHPEDDMPRRVLADDVTDASR